MAIYVALYQSVNQLISVKYFYFEKIRVTMRNDSIVMIASVVGAIIFLGLSMIFLYDYSPFDSAGNNLQLLSIGLSFVTSVLLIGIYGVLAVKQDSQNNLQKRQQELMETNHEPLLQVLNVDSYSEFIWPKMRNVGNGPTKNMQVVMHFYAENENLEISTEESTLTHSADSDAVNLSAEEAAEVGSLSPGETGKLAGEVRTPRLKSDKPDPMGYLMSDFADKDISEVFYQIEIMYDHLVPTKDTGRHFLKIRELDVRPELSVNSVIKNGEKTDNGEIIDEADNFRKPGTYYRDVEF